MHSQQDDYCGAEVNSKKRNKVWRDYDCFNSENGQLANAVDSGESAAIRKRLKLIEANQNSSLTMVLHSAGSYSVLTRRVSVW